MIHLSSDPKEKPAFIFDIDGTLIDSDGFDIACYVDAVKEVLGPVRLHDDWRLYRHATDAGILSQIIEENGIADPAGALAGVRRAFTARVKNYLEAGGSCRATPGAPEALGRLRADGFPVGIATGGFEVTARMKLARAGIGIDGMAIASSDDDLDRVKIMGACLSRLGGDPTRAIYVGNGEWDLRASREAGWGFIGVGPKLEGQCDVWVADFLEPGWPAAVGVALRRL